MPVVWERRTLKGKVNMKRQMRYRKEMCGVMTCIFLLWGCTGNDDTMPTDSGNDVEEVQNAAMNAGLQKRGSVRRSNSRVQQQCLLRKKLTGRTQRVFFRRQSQNQR